jgi:amino acid adenylation domain-containing protein
MIIKLFQETVLTYGNQVAVQSATRRLTYDELNRFANQLGRTLVENGRQKADSQWRAGILLDHGVLQPAALLGVLKAGGIYVPMDPFYPVQRLVVMADNSELSVLLTDSANLEKARDIAGQSRCEIRVINIEEPLEAADDSNLDPDGRFAYILYTSGSTGKPKGVVQTLDNVLYYTRNWIDRFQITSADRMTFLTSFCHDGAVQDIFSALLAGATLFPLDVKRTDIESKMAGWLRDNRVTIWHSVPTLFRYFAEGLKGEDPNLQHLRYILLGGEPLRDRDISLAGNLFPGAVLANIYGQTESSVNSIFEIRAADTPVKPVIGEPLRDTEILLVDDDGDIVEDMGVGEIVVACRHLAHGYWSDEELTEEKFDEDEDLGRIYWTGDLGARLGTGEIEMMGRRDFQFKIRGFRVETGDIETALLEHPAVKEAAVTAVAPDNGETFLCAYYVTEDSATSVETGDLRQFLLGRLPDYMVPSRFTSMKSMPLTANGKVDRKALPQSMDDREELQFTAPRNHIENVLAEIWAAVLGKPSESIGIDHDFFQLGGHSLKAVTLSLKIQKQLEVKIELPIIFSHTTIRRQADYIQTAGTETFTPIPPAPKLDKFPASSQQQRLHFLFAMNPDSIAYNLPQIIQLRGTIDRGKIERVFRQLAARHEALRTSFTLEGGRLFQVVHDDVEVDLIPVERSKEASLEDIAGSFIRPFDLSHPPLMRVGLADNTDNASLLLVDIHHIIADGSSLGILVREFMALFGGGELAGPRLHYKDYACWMQEPEQVELLESQKRYWLSIYEDELPLLDLPLDFPRPPIHSFAGRRVVFTLQNSLSQRLESMASACDCTLYVLMVAVYSLFLAKVSGQEDMVIGTPVSGRHHADLHQMPGMFVNTLALRLRPRGHLSVAAYLRTVKEHVLEAMNHQLYPFEELVENLDLPKDVSRNPLFDTMFMLQTFMDQEYDIPTVSTPELEARPVDFRSQRSLFDLSLQGGNTPEGLSFTLEYSAALFKHTTIQRFITFFESIARTVADDDQLPLRQISILPPDDRRVLMESFNATNSPLPDFRTVIDLFLRQGDRSPHGLAATEGDLHVTPKMLLHRAGATASKLREAGARKEIVVAVAMGQSLDTLTGILAVMLAGAAYLPLDTDEPAARIRFKLKDASVGLVLSDKSSWDNNLPEVRMLELEATHPGGSRVLPPLPSPAPEDLAYVIYTSGSTGQPKGVMVEHRNLVSEVAWYMDQTKIIATDRLLLLTNFTFDASIDQYCAALSTGAVLDIVAKSSMADPRKLLQFVRSRAITILTFVPGFLRQLLGADTEPDSVRMVVCGGEPLSGEARDFFIGRGYEVRNHYGPTETTITALAGAVSQGAVTVGKPVRNARCYILDSNQRQLPIGVFGEIAIAGAGVSRGYLNRPELQAQRFISLPDIDDSVLYITGDRGRVTPELDVEFGGRHDGQIKFRGYRLELEEIEYVLTACPGVAEAAVVMDVEDGGEPFIRCFVIARQPLELDAGARLLERCREYGIEHLPDYMVPAQFDLLAELPRTSSGKVDRKALRSIPVEADEDGTPQTHMEQTVAAIFASVLEKPVETIGRHRGFFQLGGNSLALLRLLAELKAELEVKVPPVQVFKTPTVHGLAAFINGWGREISDYPQPALLNKRGQAPIFCFPPYTGLGLSYMELAGHINNFSLYAFDYIAEEGRVALYADAIVKTAASQPAVIMGYSVGGLLALQVTAELERRGYAVAALVLLDSFMPRDAVFAEDLALREEQLLEAMRVYITQMGLDLQLEGAVKRARHYLRFFSEAEIPGPVNAPVFLLACGDAGDTGDDRGWKAAGKKKISVIRAKGHHYQMLSGGSAVENGRLLEGVLMRGIESENT